MIAFNEIVSPLFVDMSDAVKMWILSVVDLTDDAPVGVGLVSTDRDRSVQANAFDRSIQKGLRCFCISPCCEPEVDHLSLCIDGSP